MLAMTTGWPSADCISGAMMRPTLSGELPGPYGTTSLIGFVG